MSAALSRVQQSTCAPAAVAALLLLLLAAWRVSTDSSGLVYTFHGHSVESIRRYGWHSATTAGVSVAKQQASIVIVVTSAENSTDRRSWLRTQFNRNMALLRKQDPVAADGVVMQFAIGSRGLGQGLSSSSQQRLQAEQHEHGDILMLDIIDGNSPDPPANVDSETATALKVIRGTQWAVERYDFPWFVRLGDDSYFRVDHFLLNVASTLDKRKLVLGYRVGRIVPFSNSVTITKYCSGMGYILSYDVAQFIAGNAQYWHTGWPEDARFGTWLAGTNFKIQHDERFHDWEWKPLCSNDSIMVHKHDFGVVDDDGVMRSCFPSAAR